MPKKKTIPPAISATENALRNLPDVTRGRSKVWTASEDEMILKYVPAKGMPAVASILGVKYETIRRRYNDLKARA